ncbi:MAG: DNA polymerase III subunit beta [Clostridiales bacterium]|nr:DNA polymerase III subunit beta [Clostridiales bacterium]
MKITCERQSFLDAVANVQRAVSSKSTIPALEGILLTTREGFCDLSGYDLQMGITTRVEATVQEEGSVVLSARLFGDIIRRMEGELLTLETDEKNNTRIQCGQTEFSIVGIDPTEFPEIPSVSGGESADLPQNMLAGMIRQTLFAVAQNESKPVHTGILFEMDGETIRLVSLDGYRLALRCERVQCPSDLRFVVPGKTLSEVLKLLSDSEDEMTLSVGKRHIVFAIGGYHVISRLLDGEFLDYRQSIPASATSTVRVNTRRFISSVERASLLINDRMKSPVRCIFDRDELKISCTTPMGKVSDQFEAAVEGDRFEMGFNNRYLLDALRASEEDEVKLELNGPLSPMKVVPLEGDSYLFLVLPVRLKNEM